MATSILELGDSEPISSDDLARLNERLTILVGEPFQLLRFSYGDELTIHFGQLREGRNPKVKHLKYGQYIVGFRGSAWLLKAHKANEVTIIANGILTQDATKQSDSKNITKQELAEKTLIVQGTIVVGTRAFAIKQNERFGLSIELADATTLLVLPSTSDYEIDEEHAPIADWEIIMPNGVLDAWPGPRWVFTANKK